MRAGLTCAHDHVKPHLFIFCSVDEAKALICVYRTVFEQHLTSLYYCTNNAYLTGMS